MQGYVLIGQHCRHSLYLWHADRGATWEKRSYILVLGWWTQKTHNAFQIEAYSVYSDQRVTWLVIWRAFISPQVSPLSFLLFIHAFWVCLRAAFPSESFFSCLLWVLLWDLCWRFRAISTTGLAAHLILWHGIHCGPGSHSWFGKEQW